MTSNLELFLVYDRSTKKMNHLSAKLALKSS